MTVVSLHLSGSSNLEPLMPQLEMSEQPLCSSWLHMHVLHQCIKPVESKSVKGKNHQELEHNTKMFIILNICNRTGETWATIDLLNPKHHLIAQESTLTGPSCVLISAGLPMSKFDQKLSTA